jgi:hypothetical protein
MNSSFKIEDASEGSPFGFDTTFLQDYPIEVKGSDRLKKSSKTKRCFESRLLVDPYVSMLKLSFRRKTSKSLLP